MGELVLDVRNLAVELGASRKRLRPVDCVSFQVRRGQVLGLVGESGSGKSLTGLSIMGLLPPPIWTISGRIFLDGTNLRTLTNRDLRQIRGRRIAMVFQNPMSTLNPTLKIETQMIDAILAHTKLSRREAWQRCRDTLGQLGVSSPDERMSAYPHELSGGMRQRVVIAIAMINHPDLVIADEPTTALDVTVQAQILHEMQELCREQGTALIWISHDLSIVAGLSDRIAVMYAGSIVEEGPADAVLDHPQHHYTKGLIKSASHSVSEQRRFYQIPGVPPRLGDPLAGCRFSPRCPGRASDCAVMPGVRLLSADHSVRCHHPCSLGDR